MRVLLDTHVFLWWLEDDARLGEQAREAIGDPECVVLISPASAWEIGIKTALGKIKIKTEDLLRGIEENGFIELPIRIDHGLRAGALPPHHLDPFDRMLVAQAQAEELTLITHDRRIEPYDLRVLWT